jgi:hypothetical protein
VITWIWVATVGAASSKARIPEDAWRKARVTGVVSVLVSLNVPWERLGELTAQQRAAQQHIKAAQDQLLSELAPVRAYCRFLIAILEPISKNLLSW